MPMSTDAEWEKWGGQDPYFGVITQEKFRNNRLDDAARVEFFESGVWHVDHVWSTCTHHVDARFAPDSVLDFGCGVGRLLLPFARRARQVVGVDVAASMLRQARRNCDQTGLRNVELLKSDDALSAVDRTFDLVHSVIVLQHIAPERGLRLFERLLGCIAPGGVGAIQLTYAKMAHAETLGLPAPGNPVVDVGATAPAGPAPRRRGPLAALTGGPPAVSMVSVAVAGTDPGADPEMQMNSYHLNHVFFLLQRAGITRLHTEFTDHGGELGVFLFFQRQAA